MLGAWSHLTNVGFIGLIPEQMLNYAGWADMIAFNSASSKVAASWNIGLSYVD